jgi:hypothetical protein
MSQVGAGEAAPQPVQSAVRQNLGALMYVQGTEYDELVDGVIQLLDTAPPDTDPLEKARKNAPALLASVIEAPAVVEKGKLLWVRHIIENYPHKIEEGPDLPSPIKQAKRHDLDRDKVHEIHEREIGNSRHALINIVEQADPRELVEQENLLGKSNLEKRLLAVNQDLLEEAVRQAAKIQDILKATRGDSLVQSLGLEAIKDTIERKSYLFVPGSGTTQARQLRRTLRNLKQVLENLRDPDYLAEEAVHKVNDEEDLLMNIAAGLTEPFTGMISQAKANLAARLDQVPYIYDLPAGVVPAQLKVVVSSETKQTTGTDQPIGAPAEQHIEKPQPETGKFNGRQLIELGEVSGVFPWAAGSATSLSAIRENDSALLFCKAMSCAAAEISAKLRREPQYAKIFAKMWERVRDIELGNNGDAHARISLAKPWLNSKFANMVVRDYRLPSGERIYYVKTHAAKFPQVNTLATQHGITPETPLVILVAEANKDGRVQGRVYNSEFHPQESAQRAATRVVG